MKRITLTLAILLISMELAPIVLFGGNPIMLIRCRSNALIEVFGTDDCDMPGFITYAGHCYPLAEDGECPDVPGFTYLVPMEVMIDGEPVTICVPDCSTACVESCSDDVFWDPVEQGCVCDDPDPFNCGCPAPLVETFDLLITDGTGFCALPEQDCYDLGIAYSIEPFVCDGPQTVDTIRITIKPAGGGNFVPFEDALTIEDLINCDLIDGTEELETFAGLYGEDDRIAFVADASGCILVEFTRDPTMDSEIRFLGGNNETIVIPACPRAFDPCSCRPENIYDADNIVEYWYDELTFTGNPNQTITVAANNIPGGFLDNTLTPYAGPIGMTDGQGLLIVPFFRTPGFDTDVVLADAIGQTTNLMSSCTLPVNFCANIVPTLGEWSVIILALSLFILGIVAYRSRLAKNVVA